MDFFQNSLDQIQKAFSILLPSDTGMESMCQKFVRFFSASDVIPHIRNWIPTLPQRVFPCGSELISMRVRALFLAG